MQSINSSIPILGFMDSLQGGRPENQDFMGYADTPLGFLYVLCDGMGGGPGGRTASTSVVEFVVRHIAKADSSSNRESILREAIAAADNMIAETTAANPQLTGMGTTIVCLLINKKSAMVAQVGDSRLYQFRMGHKVFQTEDHSYVADLVRKGSLSEEEARLSPDSNIITRAINGRGLADPNIYELAYDSKDRFMLCTDGIWGAFPAKELYKAVTSHNVNGAVTDITYEADTRGRNAGGNHDNLSIAIIETQCKSDKRIPMSKSILRLVIILTVAFITSLSFACYSFQSKHSELKVLSDSITALNLKCVNLRDSLSTAKATISNSERFLQEKNQELYKRSQELIEAKTESEKNKAEKEQLKAENEQLKKKQATNKKETNNKKKTKETKGKSQKQKRKK